MVIQTGKNVKTFCVVLNILKAFGVIKLKASRSVKLEMVYKLYKFTLMLIYLWLGLSNAYNNLYTYSFPLAKYSTDIDRSSKVFVAVAIFIDATFCSKKSFKLFKAFDEIDKLMLKAFKVKLNYKTITRTFIILTIFNLIPVFLMTRQFLISKINVFFGLVLTIYISVNVMLQTLETFYFAIVIQLLIRLKIIENLLDKKSEKVLMDRKFVIEELMFKFCKIIEEFNENFGFIVLMLVGK